MAVRQQKICNVLCLAVAIIVLMSGCSSSGPSTVPVKGTLTIDGQPATDIMVTLAGSDPNVPAASGKVENVSFTLFSGVEGKPGCVPGKYKVVLTALGSGEAMYRSGQGAPGKAALPFPEKYLAANTSDKEVEITKGSNELNITIP